MGQVMTENAEIPHKKTKKSITIWVLSAISLVYIGIVYLLIKETETCAGTAISANWFKGFWDQYLGCRSVNELGDTLAGAFAPVAFLWLMGAVFIQSQELKAQREELDETQEVMRAQLKVSLQQVEETKASTQLFKKQTEILEKEQRLRDQKEADLVFDAKLENLFKFCNNISKLNVIWLKASKDHTSIQTLHSDDSFVFFWPRKGFPSADDLLKQINKGLLNVLEAVETIPLEDEFQWEWESPSDAKIFLEHLRLLCEEPVPLSAAYEVKRNALPIGYCYYQLKELNSLMRKKNKRSKTIKMPKIKLDHP